MPLFIHGKNHAQQYIYEQTHDTYQGTKRIPGGMKIIQFKGHKYKTNDERELELLRNVDDFQTGMLQEVPEGDAAHKVDMVKSGGSVTCPLCSQQFKNKASFVSHFMRQHSGETSESTGTAVQGAVSVATRQSRQS